MATVREDVVKVGFEVDTKGIDQANDAVEELVEKVSEEVPEGTQKSEKGFKKAQSAAKKFGGVDLGKLASGLDNVATKAGEVALKLTKTAIKGVAVGAAATTAAIVALGTASIKGYAEYEQLVGGVETLFGKSGDTVMKYANNAYKSAGLSANDYMSAVTSFSASLINSVGGDTAKAAGLADQAIQDMADNANKMGTDLDSVIQTYQSLARGNFGMLDNLKLGYGGTKAEMERLLKDAEKLTGKRFDISNFADITEAIHAIQTEMGITGTTAEEASKTIQGSAMAMKSAWSNFLTGMANEDADFGQLTDNLVDSVLTFADNLIPRIKIMLPRLISGLSKVASGLGKHIPGIISSLLPSLAAGVRQLMTSAYNLIAKSGPGLARSITSIIRSLYRGLFGKNMSTEMFLQVRDTVNTVLSSIRKILAGLAKFGKQVMDKIGPALVWIGKAAVKAFEWIGNNIDWILPVLASLFSALMAFKAVRKVTSVVSGFMSLFGKGGGAADALSGAAGGGKKGGGLLGGFANMNVGSLLKAIANVTIVVTALAGLAFLLAWAAPYFSQLTSAGAFANLLIAIAAVGLVGTALTKLVSYVGNIQVGTIVKGVANIGIVMVALGALAFLLGWASSVFNFDYGQMYQLIGMIGVVGLVGSALAGFAGIVGMVPIPAVLAGLANIALAINGMALLVAEFGALALIPGFDDFMTRGGQVLTKICGILGEMAGSIVGGIGEGITNSLPAMGENLSAFATSIAPMFTTFASVDTSVLGTFASSFARFVAVMAGEKILSIFTGGLDYASLGTQLSDMATNMSTFFTTISAIPEGGFEKATALFDCLAGISSMPKEGGVVGWFQGEVDYSKMATGLTSLADAAGFFTAIQAIPETAFTNASKLFECLAGVSAMPKDGGIAQWFTGTVDFAGIATGLQTLTGEGMIGALTAISAIPETAFSSLTAMFDALAGIKAMPKEGGLAGWFTGDSSSGLNNIASQLPAVATNIASFFTNLGGRTDFSPIANLFNTLSSIEIDSDVAEKGFFGGMSQLAEMGTGLGQFATKAATFFTTVNTMNLENLNGLFTALKDCSGITEGISGLGTAISTEFSTIVTTVQTSMETVKSTIISGVLAAVTAASATASGFHAAGVAMMQGLNNGIASMRATILSTVQSIAGAAKAAIDKAMQIHSPSRVTFKQGEFTGQGYALGMQRTIPQVQTAAYELTNATSPLNSYSPETSGSTIYNSSGGNSEVTTISPVFNLNISGSSDDRSLARKVKKYVSEAITETFESLERKSTVLREV